MISVRLVQIITLLLGVLSVVLGVVGVVSEEPVSVYQVVMILLPLLVVSSILLRRWTNIPIHNMRNLAEDEAKTLLVASVNPLDYPPCPHACVAHANAVCAAGLSSRNVFLHISQLIMIMNRAHRELNPREKVFSVNVVETHLTLLRSIHSTLVTLASDGSLVSECYRLLNGGNNVMKAIDKTGVMMESTIIRPMEKFLQSIPAGVERNAEVPGYKEKIKELIKEKIPGKLAEAMGELIAVEQTAREIHEQMQRDWHDDTQECWGDYFCKPIKVEDFRPKTKMKIDSVERTVANWIKKTMPKNHGQAKNNRHEGP